MAKKTLVITVDSKDSDAAHSAAELLQTLLGAEVTELPEGELAAAIQSLASAAKSELDTIAPPRRKR